jgi:TfoX N-terminal domain
MFDEVSARLAAEDPEVEQGRMFSAVGLKTAGRFFAMVVEDELVLKLPAERVDALEASGEGRRFDPGHGRRMREWIGVRPEDRAACEAYVGEARDFVAGGTATRG